VNWSLFVGSVALVLSSGRRHGSRGHTICSLRRDGHHVARDVRRATHNGNGTSGRPPAFPNLRTYRCGISRREQREVSDGGYIPFLLGCFIFVVIATWRWDGDCSAGVRCVLLGRDMRGSSISNGGSWRAAGCSMMGVSAKLVELDRAVVFLVSRPIAEPTDVMPVKLRSISSGRVPYRKTSPPQHPPGTGAVPPEAL